MLLVAACSDKDSSNTDNPVDPQNPDVEIPTEDQLTVKVTADMPTAVLSSFDDNSMGGALVRRLSQTTGELTPETKMILIKGEDILGRPMTEWLQAAKMYLQGGYIAVEKPHDAHLVSVMEQLADKMAEAEDELMLKDGITIVRPAVSSSAEATRSDVAARFKARIANIVTRAGEGDSEKEAVAELVIFARDGYYHCAPMTTKNILIRIRDKNGNETTQTESIEHEYTLYETGLQADGAAQWLNNRGEAQQSRSIGTRANSSDAINSLMSADEEYNFQRTLFAKNESGKTSRANAFNEIIRTWGVHNMDTNKDYYFIDQKIVASVGGKNGSNTLYTGPYEENKWDSKWMKIGTTSSDFSYYGAWYGGGDYSMNLTGAGSIQLEDAMPTTDNNGGSKTISLSSFEQSTSHIGATITPKWTMKDGASITGVFDFSKGYTQGSAFTMSSTLNYKELTCKKNTDGSKVTWTYGCGIDMMAGKDRDHPLAPDALTNDVDINNQICWSVGRPEGNYTLEIGQKTRMSSLVYDDWKVLGHPDEERKFLYEATDESRPSYTLPMPNRSQQIWNMDVTFPEITQDGYNGVKPQLTAALLQQFPSVYQPELILADQTPESENTIKRIVVASNNLLMDENSLQTLREYALTYKLSEFTIKWYCAGTNHNTYQITIKAKE